MQEMHEQFPVGSGIQYIYSVGDTDPSD